MFYLKSISLEYKNLMESNLFVWKFNSYKKGGYFFVCWFFLYVRMLVF